MIFILLDVLDLFFYRNHTKSFMNDSYLIFNTITTFSLKNTVNSILFLLKFSALYRYSLFL